MSTTLPLIIGWVLDLLFADPARLPHPIVWFGKAISSLEHRFNHGSHLIAKGAVCAISLILLTFILSWFILHILAPYRWLEIAVESILVFYCLAGTTLIREVRDVFKALERSLDDGRRQVGRIVGRDTSALSAQEVRLAALETLAENLSDGVIAPLFWYLLLGVPGMLAYKMINTLDSMIGYRTSRYLYFGRIAAHIDDIANYIPARITAILMLIVSGKLSRIGHIRRFGSQHASPNSGYPEAALSAILNCRFGGTHNYFGEEIYKPYIGDNNRPITFHDMEIATAVNRRAEILFVVIVLAVRLLLQ
jgi:adenosylcobinamide-phosphate synthase